MVEWLKSDLELIKFNSEAGSLKIGSLLISNIQAQQDSRIKLDLRKNV